MLTQDSKLCAAALLFSEHQRFRQWWLWLILIAPNVPVAYALWQQSKAGEPLDWPALFISNAIILIIIVLFLLMRLDTEIREDGVYVRFFPFAIKLKKYGWEEIQKAYVRKYKPLLEYGGWGIRYGRNGKALNVSGNQGLQLQLKNGKRLLIGTKRPAEMEQALAQASI